MANYVKELPLFNWLFCNIIFKPAIGCLHVLRGSAVGHRSEPLRFKPGLGYVRGMFHLSLHLITTGSYFTHLAYHVPKCGCKTATFTLIKSIITTYCCFVSRFSYYYWLDCWVDTHFNKRVFDFRFYSVGASSWNDALY